MSAQPLTSADDLPLLLSAEQLVDLLPFSKRTVYGLLREGEVPGARKLGRKWVIHRDTLLEWIMSGGVDE